MSRRERRAAASGRARVSDPVVRVRASEPVARGRDRNRLVASRHRVGVEVASEIDSRKIMEELSAVAALRVPVVAKAFEGVLSREGEDVAAAVIGWLCDVGARYAEARDARDADVAVVAIADLMNAASLVARLVDYEGRCDCAGCRALREARPE